ncbi:MAG: hypothetical protein P1P78_04915 [Methyloprofundus sp.]|nr:hypothetical protein [Methyloprofundus sp.]
MIDLTEEQIDCTLLHVEEGLKKYLAIQQDLKTKDVAKDRDFQKRFNHFYKVRRNAEWQAQYYQLLQKHKNGSVTFAGILQEIHKNTGRYEASFSSKLVATIHPEQPVIDKCVLKNVGLKLPYPKAKNRDSKLAKVHESLLSEITEFLQHDNGKYLVQKFKKKFPSANVTEVKMVDLVLWQTR